MYKVIANHTPARDIYRKQLISEGIAEEKIVALEENCKKAMEDAYTNSKSLTFKAENWVTEEWSAIKEVDYAKYYKDTGVELSKLREIGRRITKLPKDGHFHPQIVKVFKAREKSIEEEKGIDWGTGEALAFASLID
jgi:2-oxoglutarate dehydrogenase E1 component